MSEKLNVGIDVKSGSGTDAVFSKLSKSFKTLAANVSKSAEAFLQLGQAETAAALGAVAMNMNQMATAVAGGTKSVDKYNKSMGNATKVTSTYSKVIDNAERKSVGYIRAAKTLGNTFGRANDQTRAWLPHLKKVDSALAEANLSIRNQASALGKSSDGAKRWLKNLDQSAIAQARMNKNLKISNGNFRILNKEGLAAFNGLTEDGAKKLGWLDKSFVSSTKQATRFGKALKFVGDKFRSFAAYSLAAAAVAGTIRALAGGTTAIIDHSQALKDLEAITGATASEMIQLDAVIRKVADTTKFSAGEIAEGAKLIGQAGFSAAEVIQVVQSVSDLATGTLSSLATSADLVTTTLRVFKLEATESAMVVDVFTNSVNNSKLTIEKIKTAMNYLGPIAARAGMSFKDTSASMMILANSGMRASSIATGLRRVIANLVNPSKKMTEAIEGAGYTVEDLNPQIHDMRTIIERLTPIITGADEAFRLFGLRGATAASALVTQGVPAFDKMRGSVDKQGTAALNAQIQMEGLGVSYKNLQDKAKNVALALGDAGLTAVLRGIVDVSRKLVDVFKVVIESKVPSFFIGLGVTLGASILLIKGVSAAIAFLSVEVHLLTTRIALLHLALGGVGWVKLAAAAVVVLGAAYFATRKSLEELMNASRKQQRDAMKTISALKEERQVVKDFNGTSKEKLDLIDSLAQAYPEYAAEIYKTNGNLIQLEATLRKVEAAQEEVKFAAMTEQLSLLSQQIDKSQKKLANVGKGFTLFADKNKIATDRRAAENQLSEFVNSYTRIVLDLESAGRDSNWREALLTGFTADAYEEMERFGLTAYDVIASIEEALKHKKAFFEETSRMTATEKAIIRIKREWDSLAKPAKKAGAELTKVFDTAYKSLQDSFSDDHLLKEFENQIREINLNAALSEEERANAILEVKEREMEKKVSLTEQMVRESLGLLAYQQEAENVINDKITQTVEEKEQNKIEIQKRYAEKRKSLLAESTSSVRAELDKVVATYRDYADQVVAIEEEIKNVRKSATDAIRDLERKGMTDEEKHNDLRLEIAQKIARMEQLKGNTTAEGLKEVKSLYSDIMALSKEAGTAVNREVEIWSSSKKKYIEGKAEVSTQAEQVAISIDTMKKAERLYQGQLAERKSVLETEASEQKRLAEKLAINLEILAIKSEKFAIQAGQALAYHIKAGLDTAQKEVDKFLVYLGKNRFFNWGDIERGALESPDLSKGAPLLDTASLVKADEDIAKLEAKLASLENQPPAKMKVNITSEELLPIDDIPGSTEGRIVLEADVNTDKMKDRIREPINMVTTLGSELDSVWDDLFEGKISKFSDLWSGVMDSVTHTFQKAMSDMLSIYVNEFLMGVAGETQTLGASSSGDSGVIGMIGSAIGGLFGGSSDIYSHDSTSTNYWSRMAGGGIIPEHVVGVGLQTGTNYEFGEKGPERVLSNSDSFQQQQAPIVEVNVINKTSKEVDATQGSSYFDGRKFVVEAILEDVDRGGPLRSLMGAR